MHIRRSQEPGILFCDTAPGLGDVLLTGVLRPKKPSSHLQTKLSGHEIERLLAVAAGLIRVHVIFSVHVHSAWASMHYSSAS